MLKDEKCSAYGACVTLYRLGDFCSDRGEARGVGSHGRQIIALRRLAGASLEGDGFDAHLAKPFGDGWQRGFLPEHDFARMVEVQLFKALPLRVGGHLVGLPMNAL